jgi:catabolite regulation protein CreA
MQGATQKNVTGRVGGIVGQTGNVANCYSAVQQITVNADGDSYVGGISGFVNNIEKSAVLQGTLTGTSNKGGAVAVNRVSPKNTKTTNIASDTVVLMAGTENVDAFTNNKIDGTTMTAAELQESELFFDTGDGQLGWEQAKWKWDSVNQRPKLVWED